MSKEEFVMINIYTKSAEELEKENADYRFGATLVKGIPFEACPTYLMKRDGTRVDTKDLTEEQIINLIESDVRDFSSPEGSYKKTGRSGLDTFKLINAVKDTWSPSYDALLQIAGMEQQYGHVIADIMGSIDKNDVRGKARTIASFQKQSSGDFSQVTTDEIMTIIQQMAYNEKMKKQSGVKR